MALTRKLLEGMGIEEKQIGTIIEAHAETVDQIKAERDGYKEQAELVPDLQKQVEDLQAAKGANEGWEKKFNAEHKAFEDFKEQIEAERTETAKAQAYKELLAEAGIDPKRIGTVMRVTDLSGLVIEEGKLKDADKLAEHAKEEWADFIVKTKTVGSKPANPPKNTGGVEGADPDVARRMQERNERMYGKTDEKE